MSVCPTCECPFFSRRSHGTGDPHRTWRDTDGQWYSGGAYKRVIKKCLGCGEQTVTDYRYGKAVREPTRTLGSMKAVLGPPPPLKEEDWK